MGENSRDYLLIQVSCKIAATKAMYKISCLNQCLTRDWPSESREPDGRHLDSKSLFIMALLTLNSI